MALGVVVSADAGHRKRGSQVQVASCACQVQKDEPVKTTTISCICPMYPWANHGGYCSYYAVPCANSAENCTGGTPGNPLSYDASCGLPMGAPCAVNCLPRFKVDGTKSNVETNGNVVSETLLRGFPATELGHPIGIADSANVNLGTEQAPIWVEFTNSSVSTFAKFRTAENPQEVVCVQLIRATIVPNRENVVDPALRQALVRKTFLVGHQIRMQPDSVCVTATATLVPGCTKVYSVVPNGESNAYTVILRQ